MRRSLPFFAQTLRGAPSSFSVTRQTACLTNVRRSPFFESVPQKSLGSFFGTLTLRGRASAAPSSNSSALAPVEEIEGDMLTMINNDLETFETDPELNAIKELKDQYLASGVEIVETSEKITLKRSINGRTVVVSWDPREYSETEDASSGEITGPNETDTISEVRRGRGKSEHSKEWEDEEDQEGEEEEDEEAGDQEGRSEGDIRVKIEISHGDKTLHVVSVVSDDSLLYIYQMGTNLEKLVDVEFLSEPLQHKLYDYLSELGVGDRTSQFIRRYNASFNLQKTMDNLRVFKQFFD